MITALLLSAALAAGEPPPTAAPLDLSRLPDRAHSAPPSPPWADRFQTQWTSGHAAFFPGLDDPWVASILDAGMGIQNPTATLGALVGPELSQRLLAAALFSWLGTGLDLRAPRGAHAARDLAQHASDREIRRGQLQRLREEAERRFERAEVHSRRERRDRIDVSEPTSR